MNEKLHWLTLSGYKFIHLERKKSLILLDRCTIFLSNRCWHNHIKSTSLILTFTIFIRPAHISPLHFAAASAVVVTVQSKSVKDYSLQFSVRITALFAELKHFDDHNCAKCGKHFPNHTPFWSFSMGMSFHRQQTTEQGNWQNFIHALLLMLRMYNWISPLRKNGLFVQKFVKKSSQSPLKREIKLLFSKLFILFPGQ